MNSKILGSHTGTIANFQLQQPIKEILSRVSSFTCKASISHLLQVLCCSVPPPPCTVALPQCPSCSPPPSFLNTPGGQTPSRGSGAQCLSPSIFSKNEADYKGRHGSRLKLHSLYLFCATLRRPSHFSCLKWCVTRKRSQVTGKFNLLSSIIQVSFLNCVQFDLPASLQIISEKKKIKWKQTI